MYGVRSGKVKIYVKDQHVETVEAGGVFGEMAIIDNMPRVGMVVAETDAEIVAMDEKAFVFLVEHTPYFAVSMLRILSRRLRKMDDNYLTQ